MPAPAERPAQVWARMNGLKSHFLKRCERFAALTIPKLCLPEGKTPENSSQTHDYQSLGAAAVNHLNNRIMIALFRPGDPFFRLDIGQKTKATLAQNGIAKAALDTQLAEVEMDATAELDRKAVRPKLYQAGRHVIVTGNALMELLKDDMRVYGIRSFCVKRTAAGKLHTLIIREELKFNELEQDVQAACPNKQPEQTVHLYRLIELQPQGNYKLTQAVDEHTLLDEKFGGNWSEENLPYRVLVWDLADEADYATGLVEDNEADFEALSTLSESLLDGSVLTTEMRWLVNPGGMTSVVDFRNSKNGDAIAGQDGDVSTIFGGSPQAIEMCLKVIEVYSQRIARAFLLQSAMVRDAERVTAEEIRQLALELETAFGGVYSQLGLIWQKPVANWCLKSIDMSVLGTDLKVTVITGLDALTRNAQLEKLRAALGDLALFEQLPESLKARLNWRSIAAVVGQGRGVDLVQHLKTEDELRAEQEQAMKDQTAMAAGQSAGEAAGQQAVEQGVQ